MNKPVALVFTMHKVGSSSLMAALRHIDRNPERGYAENLMHLESADKYEKIVTSVRDPIARNISYMFEMNGQQFIDTGLSIEEIHNYYLADTDHFYPHKWFGHVFVQYAGVDVFRRKFNKKRGWSIYKRNVLVIRTKDILRELPNAFDKLFGVKTSGLHRAETVHTRPYGELYRKYLEWVVFDGDYLDSQYDTRFVRHFFSGDDIMEMREKWTNQR